MCATGTPSQKPLDSDYCLLAQLILIWSDVFVRMRNGLFTVNVYFHFQRLPNTFLSCRGAGAGGCKLNILEHPEHMCSCVRNPYPELDLL